MKDKVIKTSGSTSLVEKVYIETTEHIIIGYIYMPNVVKKERLLSEMLNSGKTFLAVKDLSLEYKLNTAKDVEKFSFLEVNLSSILIMRPIDE
ncbi:hypothetical protein IJO12_03870 [bacterium]|nr:hypothetical protein [bacterium]